jgi:2-oxoisovalerate dehydrogenase E2 component (dihydrolipoyl transacylase)
VTLVQMKLPDVGEGVAEAELVAWLVEVGQEVTPETAVAEVLTDKATVEISSPVTGVVTARHGEPGDVLNVGSNFIDIETDAGGAADVVPDAPPVSEPAPPDLRVAPAEVAPEAEDAPPAEMPPEPPVPDREASARATAAPAVRARAQALGIDLASVRGSGPDGRVVHADLDRALVGGRARGATVAPAATSSGDDAGRAEPVRGVRRRIAERLTAAWQEIPHITYVDAVDVSELEHLRGVLNEQHADRGRLTVLPFLVRAITIACAEQPRLNAHYDHATETLTTFDPVHAGIATQTDNGLLVPVVRGAEARGLWDLAAEIARVTTAARDGSATRDELSGSTITITSLGALGGLVTTPILNAPEVAIVGVNKMETRPVWRSGSFEPRQVFNLSCSFDHRMVDGWDAATFVQRIKALLETPALIFVADE